MTALSLNDAESHTADLCNAIQQAEQYSTQLTAMVASDEEEETTNRLTRWTSSHGHSAESGLRTLGAGGQAIVAARVRLGQLNLHRHQLQSALLQSQRAIRLLQQRGPMLRGVLSLLENNTISTETLNDDAVEDNLAGPTEPRDGEVMARLNPYASEEEAAARFSNLDGYVAAEHDPWTPTTQTLPVT